MREHDYQKMLDIVFSYPGLQNRLKERDKDKDKDTVIKILKEMKADFSKRTVNNFAKLLDTGMSRFYEELNLDFSHDLDFDDFVKKNNVVIVPNHQSHADYIALNYMVYKRYKFPLYVAGGINLNIFPIGPLFRKSGCFFIRRSFQNDILYKLTLEAYLYYLLVIGAPIEFFFEGGRSRTGKLLAPRLGLYQMLLTAHNAIDPENRRPLKFLPASIVHEVIPEQKTMTRELEGAKKKKESIGQLLKLFKLFSYQLGSIHIRIGTPVVAEEIEGEIKKTTWNLAYSCFREVGKNMLVTPTSLLALILLDEPIGALKWDDIILKASKILEFCKKFNVPKSKTLAADSLNESLEKALDLFIANDKINILGKSRFGHVFYCFREEARHEMLYSKNSIVHHFMVPWIISIGWIKVFNGSIESVHDLKKYFLIQRERLKYEFYLPSNNEILKQTLQFVSGIIGRELRDIEDCLKLSRKEYYEIAVALGVFARGLSYIYEGYFIASLTLKALAKNEVDIFSYYDFEKEFNYIFEIEIGHGKVIKYAESCSRPLMRNSLKYFDYENVLENNGGQYRIVNHKKLEKISESYYRDLSEQLSLTIRN